TTQRDALRAHVVARARALYTSGGSGLAIDTLLTTTVVKAARRQQLVSVTAHRDNLAVKKLDATHKDLADTQDRLPAAPRALEQQKVRLDGLVSALEQQQAALTQKVNAANAALARAREIGAYHAAHDPVIGRTVLTAPQLISWFRSRGYHPNLDGITIDDLVPIFVQESADEGLRAELVFAQSIIETGGVSSRPAPTLFGVGGRGPVPAA